MSNLDNIAPAHIESHLPGNDSHASAASNALQTELNATYIDKRAWPLQSTAALPEAFTKSSGTQGTSGGDLQIVDDKISKAMDFARSQMTAEQIARVEKEAAVPFNHIKEAGEREQQLTAKSGDSLSKMAAHILHERDGHGHSQASISEMTQKLATHNHKTDANDLKIGEVIKVPHH